MRRRRRERRGGRRGRKSLFLLTLELVPTPPLLIHLTPLLPNVDKSGDGVGCGEDEVTNGGAADVDRGRFGDGRVGVGRNKYG
eukprot:CAMPEP_0118659572 /NCGR_PEP_ID=MMETSP0785-20121206/15186_1 /TAXON_ID=91992 /ORGANISM="Bolidomonas pacifica, Strain CCMP 1866" /LENGTH=82 /DNA_ID=CAMNT_0006552691 /DNA_START=618 /DNA_END=866 /DNA_ORIENTATION=+